MTRYSAANNPPAIASRSPTIARLETVKSNPEITRTPAIATADPASTARVVCMPPIRSMRTTQTNWVVTSAVAAATEVSLRAATHVPKWSASMLPASPHRSHLTRPIVASSRRFSVSANGAMSIVAPALRQNAIASTGAAVAAINGPDTETPTIAITASRTGTKQVCRR